MESSEMEDVIRGAGWTPIQRKRRKQGRIYVYAAQRIGGKVVERYIAPLSRIETMTQEQIISKLQVMK